MAAEWATDNATLSIAFPPRLQWAGGRDGPVDSASGLSDQHGFEGRKSGRITPFPRSGAEGGCQSMLVIFGDEKRAGGGAGAKPAALEAPHRRY